LPVADLPGFYAAMHLDKWLTGRADVEVTLISRENFILFTPMLHEVAAGDLYPGNIVNPLRRILRYVKVVATERFFEPKRSKPTDPVCK
jgi:NADH:ubiquinone reductase (H+-translocating)